MFEFLRRRITAQPPKQRSRLGVARPALAYAIGDVHGCYDQLQRLVDLIVQDAESSEGKKLIVMLGDYVDRGPKSASVMDWLCTVPPAGFDRVCLAGNHEAMMLDFLDNPRADASWLKLGGYDTLISYGVSPDRIMRARSKERAEILYSSIPSEHIELLRSLPSLVSFPGTVFVHAGLRPGVPIKAQHDDDLLWIREPFLTTKTDNNVIVVHGHTPSTEPVVTDRRICVDTGAYATGVLTAARLSDDTVRFIDTRPKFHQAGY